MCFELNACTQTFAKILITRIPKGIKEDISAQIKSVKTREDLKKEKRKKKLASLLKLEPFATLTQQNPN